MKTRILLLALLVAPAWAWAQGLTPEQIASIRSVTSAAIAENGAWVAYTVSVPFDPKVENRPNTTQLWVYDVAAGTSRAVVTDGSVSAVQVRPKKGTITFLARRQGDTGSTLYEIPAAGGTPTRLHAHTTSIISYVWGSDGSHIAYTAYEPDPTPKSDLPYQPELYEQYMPDRQAWMQNVDMPGHTPHVVKVAGSVYQMAWSPDLMHLAVSAAPTPFVDDEYMAQDVHIVSHATKEVVATIDHAGKLNSIHWSPDSKRLAILGAYDLNDPTDGTIRIAQVTGGTSTAIQADFPGKFDAIRWTAANTIHFIASEGVWSSFGTVTPDGRTLTRVLGTGGPIFTAFSAAANGSVAFVASTPAHPAELFVKKSADRTAVRVTDSNPWLAGVRLGKQAPMTWTARDGLQLEGILFTPSTGDAKNLPLITVVHGGPEAHLSNGWITGYSNPGHWGAEKGYAVFYPNYRGSTGRGRAFTYSSQGDMAGKEFDDVMDGIDHLIRTGLVDSAKVGVTGGSYGGYATAWFSTYYSHRVAAGVMFVGISNNLSKWGTSDIPEELYHVHARKRIWDSWQEKLERSPVYHVANARTPLLIMHGKDDTRVHPGQSMELFRHLRVRKPDLPVELVFYPGEGHGNRNATAKYDYSLRMMGWFDRFLK